MIAIPNGRITQLLSADRDGSADALDQLMALVYPSLRKMAAGILNGERHNHTLEPSALVHEALLRLFLPTRLPLRNRKHLMGLAARKMRRILVDHARRRVVAQRCRNSAGPSQAPEEDVQSVLILDDLLQQLRGIDARAAEIVELSFFGGLAQTEIAEKLDVTPRTVQRDWEFARAWLSVALSRK
jgi:RNA polymerase sigma-70 factor (ECF subfamily)